MPDATSRPAGVSSDEAPYGESAAADASPPPLMKVEAWLGLSFASAMKIIWQAARRLHQQKQDAENLVQEVWCRVLVVSAKPGSKRPSNPGAWLNKVTHNIFISEWRHAQSAKSGSGRVPESIEGIDPPDFESASTEDVALRSVEAAKVRKALLRLPQYQQQLIADHYFEKKTLEAMSILRGNIPKTTLKSQLDAAIRDLRRLMRSESETR
ncbi:RNA polymerase sigma factor [Arthrobacter globiformis]|uniref:RNA polymerase sigma factor n=1 Tax=Arthrobacter globiformis TaxID=1665 RepID=UPI0015565357|nr:sigma-70 family RNA polymerase sigma factor [Arthrobacter globiformis]